MSKKHILFALLFSSVLPAKAALIDYGAYTRDTTNGLDWLDVTQTMRMTVNQVLADTALSSAGWHYATLAQFNQLIETNTGVSMSSPSEVLELYSEVQAPYNVLDPLIGLLGSTIDAYMQAGGIWSSYNEFYMDFVGEPANYIETKGIFALGLSNPLFYQTRIGSGVIGFDNITISHIDFSSSAVGMDYEGLDNGSFLVRSSISTVPLPGTIWLFGSGLLAFSRSIRAKNKLAN